MKMSLSLEFLLQLASMILMDFHPIVKFPIELIKYQILTFCFAQRLVNTFINIVSLDY